MHFCFYIKEVVAIFDIRSIFIGYIPWVCLFCFVVFTFQAIMNKSGAPFIYIFPTYLQLTGFSLNTTNKIMYKNIC